MRQLWLRKFCFMVNADTHIEELIEFATKFLVSLSM